MMRADVDTIMARLMIAFIALGLLGMLIIPAMLVVALSNDRAVSEFREGYTFTVDAEQCEASGIDDHRASCSGGSKRRFRVTIVEANSANRERHGSGVVHGNSVITAINSPVRPGGILNVANGPK